MPIGDRAGEEGEHARTAPTGPTTASGERPRPRPSHGHGAKNPTVTAKSPTSPRGWDAATSTMSHADGHHRGQGQLQVADHVAPPPAVGPVQVHHDPRAERGPHMSRASPTAPPARGPRSRTAAGSPGPRAASADGHRPPTPRSPGLAVLAVGIVSGTRVRRGRRSPASGRRPATGGRGRRPQTGCKRSSPSATSVRACSTRTGAVNRDEQADATAATTMANPNALAVVFGRVTRTTSHPNPANRTSDPRITSPYTHGLKRKTRYHPSGESREAGRSSGRTSTSPTRAGQMPRTRPRTGRVTAAVVCRFTHRQAWVERAERAGQDRLPGRPPVQVVGQGGGRRVPAAGSFSRHFRRPPPGPGRPAGLTAPRAGRLLLQHLEQGVQDGLGPERRPAGRAARTGWPRGRTRRPPG